MPVIAESPPIVFGGSPTPTPAPAPTSTPRPTATPGPTGAPGAPGAPGSFPEKHQQFLNSIDQLGSCFSREDLPTFSDQEFSDHTAVAMQDRYVSRSSQDTYCTMRAVSNLVASMKRIAEEQEIL